MRRTRSREAAQRPVSPSVCGQAPFDGHCEYASVILQDLLLHDCELCRQHLQAKACILRDAIVTSIFHDLKQPVDADPAGRRNRRTPTCAPGSRSTAACAGGSASAARDAASSKLCCSGLFTATNRIVGGVTASQIASASAASFFPRFT
jgi:hypothetical protein